MSIQDDGIIALARELAEAACGGKSTHKQRYRDCLAEAFLPILREKFAECERLRGAAEEVEQYLTGYLRNFPCAQDKARRLRAALAPTNDKETHDAHE